MNKSILSVVVVSALVVGLAVLVTAVALYGRGDIDSLIQFAVLCFVVVVLGGLGIGLWGIRDD